jgi:hypothetical protein
MIFADAINYAHDLVVECGKLDLPHKMEAHNAIDRIEATYKSEIQAVAENARLKAANAKMRAALLIIAGGKEARGNYEEVAWHMAQLASEALAAEGGAK